MVRIYNIYIIIFLLLCSPFKAVQGQGWLWSAAHYCECGLNTVECLEEYEVSGKKSLVYEAANLEQCRNPARYISNFDSLRVLFLKTWNIGNETDSSTHFMEQIVNPNIEVLSLSNNWYDYRFPSSLSGWSHLDTLIMEPDCPGILYELNRKSNNIQEYSFSDLQDTLKKYKAPYCEGLEVIGDLTELKYARLSVSYLPKNINKNQELRYLEIQNPDFYFIPKTISGLDKLHTFYISSYYLQQVPIELFELNNIKKISIRVKVFSDFPRVIKSENLQELSIKIGHFASKPSEVKLEQLPKLKHLFIYYPNEEKGDTTSILIGRLSALEKFDIRYYPYKNLSFKNKIFPVLKYIDINDSPKIKSISIEKIDSLKYLDLKSLDNLEKICLSRGSSRNLQEMNISYLPKLHRLHFSAPLNNVKSIEVYKVKNLNWTALPKMGATLEKIDLDTLMRLKDIKVLRNQPNLKMVVMKIMSHQKMLLDDLSYLANSSSAEIFIEMPNLFVEEFTRSINRSTSSVEVWPRGENVSEVVINWKGFGGIR